jgi:hypothetical protein
MSINNDYDYDYERTENSFLRSEISVDLYEFVYVFGCVNVYEYRYVYDSKEARE